MPHDLYEHPNEYAERVLGERARLRAAFADPAGHQRRVLDDLLAFNAGTVFGRAHGFDSVRTLAEYRKAVPIADYQALAPYIERMAAGEQGVLTADDPAVFFTSSGSTGSHKKIPVTPRFMATTFFPFFYAAWAPLLEHFPEVFGAQEAMLNLKFDPVGRPATTASGRAHVGASQVDFGARFGEPLSAEPGTRAPWATLPVAVADGDHLEKMYLRLRMAVQADVRGIVGINPAMVAAVPHQLDVWLPRILKDVHDGTLAGQRVLAPAPERAAELERLASRAGRLRPAHVWPNLRVVFCWTTGLASLYLPRLREEFGIGVSLLPAPVAASEGPLGVTLDRHGSAGSLVVTASAYEFADAEQPVHPDTETLTFDQLTPGRDYHVLFSQVGGLYRYAGGDVARVVDVVDGVPRLEYAGRSTRSDVAGEALREAPVIRALAAAVSSTGLELRNAAARPEKPAHGVHHYVFALSPHTPWSADERTRFATALDRALRQEATGYEAARAHDRLGPATVRLLEPDAFQRDWLAAVALGVRPTQVKDRLFRPDDAAWARLTADRTGTTIGEDVSR